MPLKREACHASERSHLLQRNCEAAFKVYEQCLGGHITLMMTYGSSPTASSYPGLEGKIAHATLKVGDQTLTGADVSVVYDKPQGFAVQLNLEHAEDARRIYKVLAEDGVVTMPLQKTFWAGHYAILIDRFGTPWEINCA